MAVAGDVVALNVSIAASGVMDIRPPSGQEWTIHNVYWSAGTIELYKTDGTNLIKFDTDTTNGGRIGLAIDLNNTVWLQIKNTSASSIICGYDGKQTK